MKRLLSLVLLLCSLGAEARLPDLIPYRKGNLWGYCDSTKKIIIQPQWKSVGFYSGNTAAVSNGHSWGLIDRTGREITEIKYEWISDETANGTRTASRFKGDKVGAINDRGAVVVPFEYEWLLIYGNYLHGMKKNKAGFFNSEGKIVVPFIYEGRGDPVGWLGVPGLFGVQKGGKVGVIDSAGHIIIPFQRGWVSGTGCGYIRVWAHDTVTCFNTNGKKVDIPDTCGEYDAPRLYESFRDVFEEGNPYTWLDTNGHKPTTLRFLNTSNFTNGMAEFQDFDSLYGFVNEQFEVVFPATFSFVNRFQENGLARVWIRNPHCSECAPLEGYIDTHGTRYWED